MTPGCTVPTSEHNLNQTRSTNRECLKRVLGQHSACASGYQMLENGYEYWTYRHNSQSFGSVAFVRINRKILVPGLPIVSEARLKDCVLAFMKSFEGYEFIFVGVENKFLKLLEGMKFELHSLVVGQQPEWYVPDDFERPEFKNIRRQVRRARNKNIEIEHLNLDDISAPIDAVSPEVNRLVNEWRRTRGLDTFGFMVQPEIDLNRRYGHILLARRHGELIGLLSCIPTPGNRGWYFEDLIRSQRAPNGTIEYLVVDAFKRLHTAETPYITLGMVPLHDLPPLRAGQRVIGGLLRIVRQVGRYFYNFEGLHTFKSRFRPQRWTDMHLVTVHRRLTTMDLVSVGQALANRSVGRFITRSLGLRLKQSSAKFWRWTLTSLLIPLIPWTILLACCDGSYWLGSTSIQWAWVTFDVLLGLSLMGLIQRLRTRSVNQFAWILGGATLADAILSTVQALSLHNQATGFAQLFVVSGVLGPILATLTLFALAWVNPNVVPD